METWRNWCGSVRCRPTHIARPTNVAEVLACLDGEGRVRPVGAGHSSSALAESDETLLDLTGLDRIIGLDSARGVVRVQGGVDMRTLTGWLARQGRLLRHIGTSWYPTVAGATATGTHGSSHHWGSVSDAGSLRALSLATASGERIDLRDDREADAPILSAARTHLGALGVVVEAELGVDDGGFFEVRQTPLSLDDLFDPALRRGAEHFEGWWFPHTERAVGIARSVVSPPRSSRPPLPRFVRRVVGEDLPLSLAFRLIRRRPTNAPAILRRMAAFTARPRTSVGRWDRMMVGPRWLRATSMEVALPAHHGREAIRRVDAITKTTVPHAPHHLPVNVRWARGDHGAWLSPAAGRDTVFLDFAWWSEMPGWASALRAIEEALDPLGARHHWGKVGFRNPSNRYPDFDRWAAMRARLDPTGRFLNPFLERLLAGRELIPAAPCGDDRRRTAAVS